MIPARGGRPRKLTDKQIQELTAKRDAGADLNVLAEEYGVSFSTAFRAYRAVTDRPDVPDSNPTPIPSLPEGKTLRSNTLTAEQTRVAADRYFNGLESMPVIAKDYGVSTYTIARLIRKYCALIEQDIPYLKRKY